MQYLRFRMAEDISTNQGGVFLNTIGQEHINFNMSTELSDGISY